MRKVEEKHFPNKTWPPAPPFTGAARRQTKQPSPEASVGAHQHIKSATSRKLQVLLHPISTSAHRHIKSATSRKLQVLLHPISTSAHHHIGKSSHHHINF